MSKMLDSILLGVGLTLLYLPLRILLHAQQLQGDATTASSTLREEEFLDSSSISLSPACANFLRKYCLVNRHSEATCSFLITAFPFTLIWALQNRRAIRCAMIAHSTTSHWRTLRWRSTNVHLHADCRTDLDDTAFKARNMKSSIQAIGNTLTFRFCATFKRCIHENVCEQPMQNLPNVLDFKKS